MASKTDIANLALAAVECQVVENIETDDSAPAVKLRAVWTHTLDYCLAKREWNFNNGRWKDQPAVVAARHPASEEWDYAYAKPNDCVAVREVLRKQKFEIVEGYVCTDAGPTITLRGARRVTQCGRYPVWFVNYLSAELAFRIAKDVSGSETVRETVKKLRDAALLDAGSMDAREGTPRQPGSQLLASRLTDTYPDIGLLEE